MPGRDLKVQYTWIHGQQVHIHSWKCVVKNYTAATAMANTMVTREQRHMQCSILQKGKIQKENI